MPYQVPLLTSASVVCDALGNGTVRIGPTIYGHSWQVNLVAIQNDSTINQSETLVYLNSVPIGGSWSGNMDNSSAPITLQCGDQLVFAWSGADPNSNSLVTLSGIVTDQRNR